MSQNNYSNEQPQQYNDQYSQNFGATQDEYNNFGNMNQEYGILSLLIAIDNPNSYLGTQGTDPNALNPYSSNMTSQPNNYDLAASNYQEVQQIVKAGGVCIFIIMTLGANYDFIESSAKEKLKKTNNIALPRHLKQQRS
jgi:hypothetical protein